MFFNQVRNVGLTFRNNARCFNELVRIVEVGPRDGLQNESKVVPTATKIELIERLAETGLKSIEVTSFVSPKWVPQMADSEQVFKSISKKPGVDYGVLVPNEKGFEKAKSLGVKDVAVFTAASESFSQKNTNCSIEEGLNRALKIRELCKENKIKTRGYISCIVGCPYEGDIKPVAVAKLAEKLLTSGCYEVSLGDTIGVATPKKIATLLDELKKVTGGDLWRFAIHCHDTYGQAIGNIYECLRQGIRVFDSSVAGLGGCPYAPGASGNIATEDLLYLLNEEGMESGVDLEKVIQVGDFISKELNRQNSSKVGAAIIAKDKRGSACN